MKLINPRFVPWAAAVLLVVVAGSALFVGLSGRGGDASIASPSGRNSPGSPAASFWLLSPSAGLSAMPEPTRAGPAFQSIDVLATPTAPPRKGALPTDQVDSPTPRRPVPIQSAEWLDLKAAGRIAVVDGHVVILEAGVDPLVSPKTGLPVPSARTLDTSYARWIIEPLGYGSDAKGNHFSNRNYWDLCEAGATTAALYYWQQLTGAPNVTGTAGY